MRSDPLVSPAALFSRFKSRWSDTKWGYIVFVFFFYSFSSFESQLVLLNRCYLYPFLSRVYFSWWCLAFSRYQLEIFPCSLPLKWLGRLLSDTEQLFQFRDLSFTQWEGNWSEKVKAEGGKWTHVHFLPPLPPTFKLPTPRFLCFLKQNLSIACIKSLVPFFLRCQATSTLAAYDNEILAHWTV